MWPDRVLDPGPLALKSTERERESIYIQIFWPFQKYCTYIEPIVNLRWAKTGVPGEKPPDSFLV